MANGKAQSNWIFGGVAIAALGLIGWLWRTNAFPTKLSQVAVALRPSRSRPNKEPYT
jgi:hypothetical protein